MSDPGHGAVVGDRSGGYDLLFLFLGVSSTGSSASEGDSLWVK